MARSHFDTVHVLGNALLGPMRARREDRRWVVLRLHKIAAIVRCLRWRDPAAR